jgi:hypothetical protein
MQLFQLESAHLLDNCLEDIQHLFTCEFRWVLGLV